MPFLRVVRDKRGYETTYLIHAVRDGAHPQSRILYVFRSPGGVRVGRSPFEPEVRREIEARHPDVAFDWDALLSGQQLIDSTPDLRRARKRPAEGAVARRVEPPPPKPRLVVPAAIEGETPELQMRFLAHWHGILCEQLPRRIGEADRRDALMVLVDRLNPAGWVDADEIAGGLERATAALEQLSRAFNRRRRKPKRGVPQASGGGVAAPVQEAPQVEAASVSNPEPEPLVHSPAEEQPPIPEAPSPSTDPDA